MAGVTGDLRAQITRQVVRACGTPGNVVGTVRGGDGDAVARGAGDAAAGDEEGVFTLSYLWNTAGADAGAYTYELRTTRRR